MSGFRSAHQKASLIAIGSSTGGPQALITLFGNKAFPSHVPIVLTQHMPPLFTANLATQLARVSGRPCHEAKDGQRLERGQAYLAPGDQHMLLMKERNGDVHIVLSKSEPENYCRPSVDPMLRSVAEIYGAAACAVILTGMGQDGLDGCRAIRQSGGTVVAQNFESSVVWGMPGAVVKHGYADEVLSLEDIPAHLSGCVEHALSERRHAQ